VLNTLGWDAKKMVREEAVSERGSERRAGARHKERERDRQSEGERRREGKRQCEVRKM